MLNGEITTMEKIEITKEMDFALEWVGNNAKNYAFIPDMLLAFTKDYNEALKQSENVVLDGVSNSDCIHKTDRLRILSGNISCLDCKGYWEKKTDC